MTDTDKMREFVDEVKQLCKDFSDQRDRPYTGGSAPDPDMAHAAHCSDADCVRCAAINAAIAAEREKK